MIWKALLVNLVLLSLATVRPGQAQDIFRKDCYEQRVLCASDSNTCHIELFELNDDAPLYSYTLQYSLSTVQDRRLNVGSTPDLRVVDSNNDCRGDEKLPCLLTALDNGIDLSCNLTCTDTALMVEELSLLLFSGTPGNSVNEDCLNLTLPEVVVVVITSALLPASASGSGSGSGSRSGSGSASGSGLPMEASASGSGSGSTSRSGSESTSGSGIPMEASASGSGSTSGSGLPMEDPESCPFNGIDGSTIDCRSICVNMNIGNVSTECERVRADLCNEFLISLTNTKEFDSAVADTVVSVTENFEDNLRSALGYVDILFSYFENFTAEAVTYLNTEATEDILDVFDDFLNDSRIPDWDGLEADTSQRFLERTETLGLLLAMGRNGSNTVQYNGTNIKLAVERPTLQDCAMGSYQFVESIRGSTGGLGLVNFPINLLCNNSNACTGCSAVSTYLVRNLANYVDEGGTARPMANSVFLSAQVFPEKSNFRAMLENEPINLEFDKIQSNSGSDRFCAFWDFDINDWSTANVTTLITNNSLVTCESRHLTSFAILVQLTRPATVASFALTLVSYIGCGISIVCLLLTIALLITLRKRLNKGPLLYIHLNLAIALLFALVVFVAGIETATAVPWACTLVAAMLHYFFLCVFCWMLAEGIMLYLLVVRVFGTAAEKWYYLLILGWGLPIPIVAASAAVLHEDYGNSNYCWITTNITRPTMWLFVCPMLTVILINTVILIMTMTSMVRGRQKSGAEQEVKSRTLVKATIKGTVVLLPLLGLTWIFGLFAVNENTVVFAWLFTIINSLQGAFILVLHVLRNKHVLRKIKLVFSHTKKPKGSSLLSDTTHSTKELKLEMKPNANFDTGILW